MNIHCFIPKGKPTKALVSRLRKGLNAKQSFGRNYHYNSPDKNSAKYKAASQFDIDIKNSYNHLWIKKSDYHSIQRDTKSKTSDSMDAKIFGNVDSIKRVVPDLDRSRFCERNIQNYNDPTNPAIATDCTKRLNSKIPFQEIPPYLKAATYRRQYRRLQTYGKRLSRIKRRYSKYF